VPNLVQRYEMGDYYHAGWLCVVKSVSDLAAMGACPTGVVVSVDFPVDTRVDDFDSFFRGVVECVSAHGTALLGGNIKEAQDKPHAVSCAIGTTDSSKALFRGNANPGDLLFVVDRADWGGFWAGIASHLRKDQCSALPDGLLSSVRDMALKPRAKVKQGQVLLAEAPPAFCMDNSDGLLASAFDLAKSMDIDVMLTLEGSLLDPSIQKVAQACDCDARAWALGWGSCHLLCAADKATVTRAEAVLRTVGSELVIAGEVRKGNGQVYVNGQLISQSTSASLRGDQFNPASFWQIGPKQYTEDMLSRSLEEIIGHHVP